MGQADGGFAIDRAENSGLTDGDRIAMCGEVFAPLVGLEFEKLGEMPFRLAASIRDLPEVAVFSTRVGGLSMERTQALIAADGKAGFALTIIRRGTAQIVQRDREACIEAGEAALTTGADTVSLRFPHEVDGLTIMPSRAPLAALVPNLDDLVARPIPADSEALALLARYAEMVHQAPPDTPELRHLVAAHLFDLTALALGAIGEAAEIARGRGARAARLAALKQDVESRLTEPGLSIGALAARHAISPRYAARLFADEGVPVYDADAAVHRLYEGEAVAALEAAFPGVTVDGKIDRQKLGARVFDDLAALKLLEEIVHPLVHAAERRFLDEAAARGAEVVVLDIPLLYETGGEGRVDAVVVVSAPAEIQRARVMERPGMTPNKFAALLSRQLPDAEKRRRADFVVDTSKGIEPAREQVRAILAAVARMPQKRT